MRLSVPLEVEAVASRPFALDQLAVAVTPSTVAADANPCESPIVQIRPKVIAILLVIVGYPKYLKGSHSRTGGILSE
jgi:hypothetical protein